MPRQKVTLKLLPPTVDVRQNYKQPGSLVMHGQAPPCCEFSGWVRCTAAHPALAWLAMKPPSETCRSVPARRLPSLIGLKGLWQISGSWMGDDGQADF